MPELSPSLPGSLTSRRLFIGTLSSNAFNFWEIVAWRTLIAYQSMPRQSFSGDRHYSDMITFEAALEFG